MEDGTRDGTQDGTQEMGTSGIMAWQVRLWAPRAVTYGRNSDSLGEYYQYNQERDPPRGPATWALGALNMVVGWLGCR